MASDMQYFELEDDLEDDRPSLPRGEGLVTRARRLTMQYNTPRNKLFMGIGVLALLGVIVAVAITRPSEPNQAESDNSKTNAMLTDVLEQQAASGTASINQDLVGATVSQLLQSTLETKSLNLKNVKVALKPDAISSRNVLLITGDTVVFGMPAEAEISVYHYNDDVVMLVSLTPDYSHKTGVNTLGTTEVTLNDVTSSLNLPATCKDIRVSAVKLLVSTHRISKRKIVKGLNLVAKTAVGTNTGVSPVLKAFQPLLDEIVDREEQAFQDTLDVVGSLKPILNLNISAIAGQDFQLSSDTVLSNLTVQLCTESATVAMGGHFHVSPPVAGQIKFGLYGTLNLEKNYATLEGWQNGEWDLPHDIVLSKAIGSARVDFSPTSLTLTLLHFSGDFDYGSTKCNAAMSLPFNKGSDDEVPGLQASCSGLSVEMFPHVNRDVAHATLTGAAIVITGADGKFKLNNEGIPMEEIDVVKGLNLALGVKIGSATIGVDGQVATDGAFFLEGVGHDIVLHRSDNSVVTLTEVTAHVSSAGADGFKGTMSVDSHISESPLGFSFSAEFTKESYTLSGDLNTKWTLPIAAQSTTINSGHVEVTEKDGNHSFVFSAVMTTASHLQFSISAELPDPAHPNCGLITVEETHGISVVGFLNGFIPGFASVDMPSAASRLFDTTMRNIKLGFSLHCQNVSLSADITSELFGEATVGIQLFKQDNAWQYVVFVHPGADWSLSSSSLVHSGFPKADLDGVSFFISSAVANVSVPVVFRRVRSVVSYALSSGFTLEAQINVKTSSAVNILRNFDHSAEWIDLKGQFNKTGYSISAFLPQGVTLNLGHGMILKEAAVTLTDEHVGAQFNLSAAVTIPNPTDSGDSIDFDVSANVTSDQFSLEGSAKDAKAGVNIPVGSHGTMLNSLSVEVETEWHKLSTQTPLLAVSGKLKGEILAGITNQAKIDVALELMKDTVDFQGQMVETPPLTFGDLVSDMAGHDVWSGLSLPQSLSNKIQNSWAFDELQLNFTSKPASVNCSGAMEVFGSEPLDTDLHIGKFGENSAWAFALGIDLGDNGKMSDVVPMATKGDVLPTKGVVVAVASAAENMTFLNGKSYPLDRGLNFLAALPLSGSKGLDAIAKFTHMDEVLIKGVIESDTQFVLHADITGNLRLWNFIDITGLGLILRVNPTEAALGIESYFNLKLSNRPQDTLDFHGDLMVSELGLRVDVSMTNDWVHPFGIPGVTIDKCALALEVDWDLLPSTVGVAGGLKIGDVSGSASVYITQNAQALKAELDNIFLNTIIDSVLSEVGVHKDPKILNVLLHIGFEKAFLRFNDGPTAVTFDGQSYPPGLKFDVDGLNLWNIIKGSADLQISSTGFVLNATLQPINLLDGAIVVSGAKSDSDPATLYLRLDKSSAASMDAVKIDGGIDLFFSRLAIDLTVNADEMSFMVDMSFIDHLLEFKLLCQSVGPTSAPTDFKVQANFTDHFIDYLSTEVPKLIQSTEDKVNSNLNSARATLQAKIDGPSHLKDELAALKAQDTRAMDEAQAKLDDARNKVARAKSHVDSIQGRINEVESKMHHLPWYLKFEDIGYGIEVAALWVAMKTADGVLDLANDALEAASKVVSIVPDIDPRIVALETAIGVEDAGLEIAKAAVSAAEKVYDGVSQLAIDILHAVGEILNIEELDVSGSLKDIKKGDLANIHVKGIFLGHNLDFTVDIDLHEIDSFLHVIWKEIVKLFT